jgi:hypothetical protein
MKQFLDIVKQDIEKDFLQWTTDQFITDKNILYHDFLRIIYDTSIVIDKFIVDSYIFFHLFIFFQVQKSNLDVVFYYNQT